MKILLIDDHPDIGLVIKKTLEPYHVDQAFSLAEAAEMIAKNDYNLFIIDVSLPDGSGFDYCAELAKTAGYQNVPRVLLTARSEVEQKVFGFYSGADDYITKPFSPQEFRARIEARLRAQNSSGEIKIHDFLFNTELQTCHYIQSDQKIDLGLTPTEFKILLILMKQDGEVISRETLANLNWKAHGLNIETRGIDAHVTHLRKKIGSARGTIVSIYNKGYIFKKAA